MASGAGGRLLQDAVLQRPRAPRLGEDRVGDAGVYLEIGDRTPADEVSYPDDDLKALLVEGKWKFVHADGKPC